MPIPYERPATPVTKPGQKAVKKKPAPTNSAANQPAPVQPDYAALLSSDPILQQAIGAINAQGVKDQADVTAQRRQALIGYGGVPEGAGVGDDVADPATRQLAQQSTEAGLSTLARLKHGYEQNQGGDISSLAARGMLHSGAFRQHSMENLLGYQTSTADAQQDLLSRLSGISGAFRDRQQGRADSVGKESGSALQRLTGMIGAGAIGAGVRTTIRARKPAVRRAAPMTIAELHSRARRETRY